MGPPPYRNGVNRVDPVNQPFAKNLYDQVYVCHLQTSVNNLDSIIIVQQQCMCNKLTVPNHHSDTTLFGHTRVKGWFMRSIEHCTILLVVGSCMGNS